MIDMPADRLLVEAVLARVDAALDTATNGLDAEARERVAHAMHEAVSSALTEVADAFDRQHRLAALGAIAGGVLHELRNPLCVIETSAYILKEHCAEEPISRKHIARIEEQITTAQAVLAEALDVARCGKSDRKDTTAAKVASRAASLVARPANVKLEIDAHAHDVKMSCHTRRVGQVLVNLLRNAYDALGEQGGTVHVDAKCDDHGVEVCVSDDGPGVAVELREKLFAPLFTTKREGTGLGLVICRRIAREHGGDLTVSFPERGGSRFTLRLPVGTKGTSIG